METAVIRAWVTGRGQWHATSSELPPRPRLLYQDNDLGKNLRAEGLSTRGAASRSSASGGTRADFRPGEPAVNLETTSNTAPTHDAPVVWLSREGDRRLDALKWGLACYFTKDLGKARKPINVRSETIASPACSRTRWPGDAVPCRLRCISSGATIQAARRRSPSGALMACPVAFGGIREASQSSEGEMLQTFTKIATDANNLLAAIQDWMPVIIDRPTGRRALARQKVIRHAASARTQWRAAGVAGWQEGGQRAERRPGADQSDCSGSAPFQARI
jgi:putative SOS response-associated peptidase YedK